VLVSVGESEGVTDGSMAVAVHVAVGGVVLVGNAESVGDGDGEAAGVGEDGGTGRSAATTSAADNVPSSLRSQAPGVPSNTAATAASVEQSLVDCAQRLFGGSTPAET
jgi:hypothetical protein